MGKNLVVVIKLKAMSMYYQIIRVGHKGLTKRHYLVLRAKTSIA